MRAKSLTVLVVAVAATLAVATPGALATPSVAAESHPAKASETTFVGSLGSCTTTHGALVAVDFKTWQGPAVRGCDTTPTTGIDLLKTAGFTTAGDQHDGPQFLCRIGHPLFDNGTQYPTPAQDPCVVTPPASAYWSYWLAPKGSNTWMYAQFGAYSQKTVDGDVQAWTFGGTDVEGTRGQPSFTPNQARAGLPAGTAASARRLALRAANGQRLDAGASTPDLASAANYLVNGTSPFNNDQPNLVDGHYYDIYGLGFADYGLTMDAIFALAAAGDRDADLTKIVDFLDQRGKDPSGRSIDAYTSYGTDDAQGGSLGKEALAAEVVGRNPRAFGGHDLIKTLDGLVCSKQIVQKHEGYTTTICDAAGNFRNSPSTFAQVLPIIAMLRAGDSKGAAKPIAYLEGTQHADGSFPSIIPSTGDSETDSTGMAAMGLALVPGTKARTALAKALKWLAGKQAPDGGFLGAAGDSTNSAAIVIQALRLDAQTYATQIAKADKFLAHTQNKDGGFSVGTFDPSGQPTTDTTSDVRASTQALGGAVGTPFGSVLDDLTAKSAADTGAGYLVDQLTGAAKDHYDFPDSTSADDGLTSDGLFALLAAGGHDDTVAKMAGFLKGEVNSYADPAGKQGGPYSGSLAKLALVAESTGSDPHAFGGTDLLSLLGSKVCTAKIAPDKFGSTPCTGKGDFYNAFSPVSQALGVLALQASPTSADHLTASSPAVIRLHQLQCTDGGFSSTFIAAGAKCTSEPDTTGFVVQALAAVQGTDTWLGAAQSYLEKAQLSSGLYSGAVKSSSNSTALAADALQTLDAALTSPTADPPQPTMITPIATWQRALTGLSTLAVSGGGFRISSATDGADLRASTQAVAAAAQRTLLAESGAPILSQPRVGAAPTRPGSPSPSGSHSSGGSSGGAAGGTTSGGSRHHAPDPGHDASTQHAGDLASTGLDSAKLLLWSLVLLVVGAGLTLGTRRRGTAAATSYAGRHR